tara:strand:+ start:2306 stop:2587 length:282 start_codon:yes stop_codon:yes gene_type:complete
MQNYKAPDNSVHFLDSPEFEHLLPTGSVSITDAEASSLNEAAQTAFFNSLTYAEKRAAAYPSIADQLDQIYHEGVDAWKETISAVKAEYPKGV